jgi:hypothetical protein
MNTREQLNQYLRGLESRLRLLTVSRGVAIAFGVALGATLALVFLTNAYAFSPASMMVARVVLYVSLAVAIGLGLVIPLLQLNERRAAGKAEEANPEFEQRLLTYIERREQQDPMLELLAEDTLEPVRHAEPLKVVPQKSIFAFFTGAGAAMAVLLWLILAAPGYLGFGARTLWAGLPKAGEAGFYQIRVEPGDETVRRRTDVSIVATLVGFTAPQVRLMAKYESSAKWEELIMAPRPGEAAYGFLLAAVPEGFEYYVEAAGVKSKTFRIGVVDLPGIQNIKVTYKYPAWMRQPDSVEDPGGDLRAVVGTVAELTVETDKPLNDGLIVLQDGTEIPLKTVSGNTLTARVPIEKEGAYHFAAKVSGEVIRLTPDYFIEAQEDQGPKVSIVHPRGDANVNPIEEVIVLVEADDDFGVTSLKLHYSVNGEPERVVDLNAKGGPTASGRHVFYLEDFNMIPGDVISMYATARDARNETASDIAFIQAMPFEKNYSQSQQGGGGGGGGGGEQQEQNEISRRQREIISLTHKAIKGSAQDKAAANKERAEFLSEVQRKLRDQAESLANRIRARELDGESPAIREFVKEIQAAAREMGPAADLLAQSSWEKALTPENKALQHLQRAEQLNRDIQVAFGNQGGGGGGGGGNAGRDLANLFDLELDTEKNQYEQAQSARGGSQAEQQQQQIDEALKKLEELARRQQQLAQNQNKGKQQTIDRRWEQESLRREAEELRRQIEQMQQQGQSGQQGRNQQAMSRGQQGQQGQSGQSGQQGQQGQQGGSQGAQQRQVQQLLDRMRQAEQDMREAQAAAAKGDDAQAQAAARRAAERLQEGVNQGQQMQRQSLNAGLGQLQQRTQDLAERQRQAENRLKQLAASKDGISAQQRQQLAAEKEQMAKEYQQLERDLQRQAQQLRQSDPDAARALREGVAEAQQSQVRERFEYGVDYIRRGGPSDIQRWLPQDERLTRAMDQLSQAVREAQSRLGDGARQAAGQSEVERQVATIENLRQQLERLQAQQAAQRGQSSQQQGKQGQQGQPGQQGQQGQQGGGQAGGQQGGGQQGGNQAGGFQQGGDPYGGGAYGGGSYGGYDRFGRYNPQGIYDRTNLPPVDPRQIVREAQRDLQGIRQAYRDRPELAGQAAALERELQNLAVGNPSGPELEQRLSRTILPQLESLEVQLRQRLAEEEGGQVRSGATDRTPAGFAADVAEYFRRLSRSK